MPPSPSLSARRTKTTYFSDTISSSAQKVSDTIPSTSPAVGTAWPVRIERDREGIKRAGADVAIYDAERGKLPGTSYCCCDAPTWLRYRVWAKSRLQRPPRRENATERPQGPRFNIDSIPRRLRARLPELRGIQDLGQTLTIRADDVSWRHEETSAKSTKSRLKKMLIRVAAQAKPEYATASARRVSVQ